VKAKERDKGRYDIIQQMTTGTSELVLDMNAGVTDQIMQE
jgi:hypothetical protein